MIKNVEQEIWNDFKNLSESSLMDRLSYSEANSHFGVVYEDKNSLIHNGINKRLQFDEDYKINKFLLSADYKDVDWNELLKLYPSREKIIIPINKSVIYPPAKFRTKKEHKEINIILLNDWEEKKKKLHSKIPNEKIAKEYLINIRWNDKPLCPRCNSERVTYLNSAFTPFKCNSCRFNFSEKIGTIFKGSQMSLIKWYEAMYLLTSSRTSKISQHQLARSIEVTQKTAFSMVHKIKSKVNDEILNKIKTNLFT